MNTPTQTPRRPLAGKCTFIALCCALNAGFIAAPSASAAEPKSEQARALPLTATFEKIKTEETPPFVLKLKNTSKETVEATATIYLSVLSHNRDRARKVPAHKIAAGETWTIEGLAALDKVTIEAKGFTPLHLEVK